MKAFPMWNDCLVEVCRRHPDLVAVYESAHGRLGLLLRQTLMPLAVERVEWMAETRTVARGVITDLRSAGFVGGTVVLQWLPPDDVARIVARWIRRWDGNPARRIRPQRISRAAALSRTGRARRTSRRQA